MVVTGWPKVPNTCKCSFSTVLSTAETLLHHTKRVHTGALKSYISGDPSDEPVVSIRLGRIRGCPLLGLLHLITRVWHPNQIVWTDTIRTSTAIWNMDALTVVSCMLGRI